MISFKEGERHLAITFNDLSERTCELIARRITEGNIPTYLSSEKRESAYEHVLKRLYEEDPLVCETDLQEVASEVTL